MGLAGLDFNKSLSLYTEHGLAQLSNPGIGSVSTQKGLTYQVLTAIPSLCAVSVMASAVRSDTVFLRVGKMS